MKVRSLAEDNRLKSMIDDAITFPYTGVLVDGIVADNVEILEEMAEWCRDNTKDSQGFSMKLRDTYRLIYAFRQPTEAVGFRMRFSEDDDPLD